MYRKKRYRKEIIIFKDTFSKSKSPDSFFWSGLFFKLFKSVSGKRLVYLF